MADSKRVLSVGQCGMDSGTISRTLARDFSVSVQAASTHAEALALLEQSPGAFELVLVNRVTDRDGTPGMALIERIKANPDLAHLPILLVSNYADAQAQAQAAGALPGFGKSELGTSKYRTAVEDALKTSPARPQA